MIFAIILAGGIGSRMGKTDKPKQFLVLGDKPILIHTIERFTIHDKIDKIIVLTPKEQINYTKDLIKKYNLDVDVIEGGAERIDTLNNGIDYILENYPEEEHIVLTHDAVRPFVTHRIIDENIEKTEEFGACDTVIPSTDTIVESENHETISNIPKRSIMYQGQTPQSFKLNKLNDLIKKLDSEEKAILTDACKIFTLKGEEVALVKGDISNIKITYPFDLKVANYILNGGYND